ncbi:MAG: VWA domain-containing protein [Proteobacteria bacterium]|jgi:Ca-activated chloride channel homolog|nr:VWA domain-containing protein [Pseudomonadota bacterium]
MGVFELGSPWAMALLVLVVFLPVRHWLTGTNVLAVPSIGAMKRRFSPRLALAWLPSALQLLGLGLLVVALARPHVVHRDLSVESDGLDIMLVVDTSGSMEANDFSVSGRPTNRLQVAKGVMSDFIEGRPFDRIGVVVFGEEAYTQVPLTLDHETLQAVLKEIEIGDGGQGGTAIGSAIAISAKRLKDLEAKEKLVILLTDGQNNAGRVAPLAAADACAALDIKVYSIGVGSRGGFIRSLLSDGIDERMLNAVSETTGAQYFRATDTRGLKDIFANIDLLEPSPAEVDELLTYRELYRYPLVVGLVLLMVQMLLSATWLRRGP